VGLESAGVQEVLHLAPRSRQELFRGPAKVAEHLSDPSQVILVAAKVAGPPLVPSQVALMLAKVVDLPSVPNRVVSAVTPAVEEQHLDHRWEVSTRKKVPMVSVHRMGEILTLGKETNRATCSKTNTATSLDF